MPARKRKASGTPEPADRRRSGRISSSAKKSKYFEGDTESDGDPPAKATVAGAKRRGRPLKNLPVAAKPGGKKADVEDGEPYAEDEPDDDPPAKATGAGRKRRVRPPKKAAVAAKSIMKKEDVEEEEDGDAYAEEESEDKDDDDDSDQESDDEDAAPRVTIIPYKELRDTGGVRYEDERLHKNTMLFLKDLKANNKRSWLKCKSWPCIQPSWRKIQLTCPVSKTANDAEYRRSLTDWNTFVETLTEKIIAADPTIPELPIKDVVFRIYRDIRFSKDPTPYKPHYSAAFSRTGRKGPYACYYVHCEPGSCFVGGGTWMPDARQLAKLRASVDEHPRRWRRVLSEDNFRGTCLPGTKAGDEDGCVKAFAKHNKDNALKTKPKVSLLRPPLADERGPRGKA